MLKRFLLAFWSAVLCFFVGCRAIEPEANVVESYVDECRDYPELCSSPNGDVDSAVDSGEGTDGDGGNTAGMPSLNLPFPVGEYWQVTQTYNPSNDTSSSHQDYGGTYSDDRYAIDFAQGGCTAYGKPVNPMAEGEVYYVDSDDGSGTGYGNTVIIRHQNSFYSRYAHFSEILVNVGDIVDTNDYIGTVGNTGNVSGTACSEYPGTHLHIALYKDGEGVKPEPLSGNSLTVGCWYDRLGDVSCSGDPGSYEDEIDDEGQLTISYLAVNPENGTAGETEFVWTTVVNSPDLQPEATLLIHNPNDGVNYEFEMETESAENPWIFSYQKTLRDPATYTYWVKASNGDGNAVSDTQMIRVDDAVDTSLNVNSISWTPLSGTAEETEFTWSVSVTSSTMPSVDLYILNPNDATTYAFTMSVSGAGSSWTATYSKTLRDATTYAFWAVADNGVTTSVSSVGSLTVSDPVVEGSGGGDTGDVVVDTGVSMDTGSIWIDTGSSESYDTGSVFVDTGSVTDTGEVLVDTGSVGDSGSAESTDSDTEEVEVLDTGSVPVDSSDSAEVDSVEIEDSAGVSEDSAPEEADSGEIYDTASVDSGTEETDTGEVVTEEVSICTYTVPTDYSSIQDAIDVSTDGDVVCVESGTYTENLTIDGIDLTLVSLDGAASTIIDGGAVTHVVTIEGGSSASVEGFTIQNGYNWLGGGLYIDGANPTIKHCVMTDNLPYGIAVYNYAAPVFENVLSVENDYRGVFATNYSNPEFVNSVIAGNIHDGVGIYTGTTVYLTNTIIANNGDYGIGVGSSSGVSVTDYCDVYGNTKGNYYSASASGTDFSSDPSFVDTDRYELSSGSSCVDAGDSSTSYNDVDGSRNDLGAYGGPYGSW